MNLPAYEHEASPVSAITMQRTLNYHPQSTPAHFDQKKYF